jgi:hypothetical protein
VLGPPERADFSVIEVEEDVVLTLAASSASNCSRFARRALEQGLGDRREFVSMLDQYGLPFLVRGVDEFADLLVDRTRDPVGVARPCAHCRPQKRLPEIVAKNARPERFAIPKRMIICFVIEVQH